MNRTGLMTSAVFLRNLKEVLEKKILRGCAYYSKGLHLFFTFCRGKV